MHGMNDNDDDDNVDVDCIATAIKNHLNSIE